MVQLGEKKNLYFFGPLEFESFNGINLSNLK